MSISGGIGFGDFYPELVPHPREGTPKRGRADKRPEGGGDYFRPRGIGLDTTPGCFVCGGPKDLYSNISAFVGCKAAGERVVAMFDQGARLDYREYEPDRVQVKIGACDKHKTQLEQLGEKTSSTGILTEEILQEVLGKDFNPERSYP
jgi:hypothetical protein